ncbi:hypothetical protein F4808DRAFT_144412 [Astrocystis sublimbata]|nr:hypothetical protein F4808DRAFT_144412 [Astrocystis sublimbata]
MWRADEAVGLAGVQGITLDIVPLLFRNRRGGNGPRAMMARAITMPDGSPIQEDVGGGTQTDESSDKGDFQGEIEDGFRLEEPSGGMETSPDFGDRSRALRGSRGKKKFYARKGKNLYRVEHIADFQNANDATFVKKAMQQEIQHREDYAAFREAAIRDWDDGWLSDVDDGEDEDKFFPDDMRIDDASDRRRQLEGFQSELYFNWQRAEKAADLVGCGELAGFDAGILPMSQKFGPELEQSTRIPEFAGNSLRNKPHAQQVEMNHILALEDADFMYD